jgi:hypothetical protein
MGRLFEFADESILSVGATEFDAHCKRCGVLLPAGEPKLKMFNHGTRLSFCKQCVTTLYVELTKNL